MQAARRLYLYAMSGITLAVIATGAVLLLQALLDGIVPRSDFADAFDNTRQGLSQAIAMLGVGIPVWAVHWWLIQRSLRPASAEREAERRSDIRAAYLTAVLVVSLVVWVSSSIDFLRWLATQVLFSGDPEFAFHDPLGALTTGITGFAIWLYHGLVRRHDLAAGPVSGAAAWLPRLYLYGVSLGALLSAVSALDTFIGQAISSPFVEFEDNFSTFYVLERAATAIAWGIVWFAHWTYAARLVRDPGWRGAEERVSRMRAGAYAIAIVVSAGATLIGLAGILGALLALVLPEPGFETDRGFNEVVASLLRAVPWAIVWFGHARAFRREPAAADPLRALHQERLVSHGIAAAALAIGAAGTGWILGYLIDFLLGGQRSVFGLDGSLIELRQWLPFAVVGMAAWYRAWRTVIARRVLDPIGEARSTIRRAFLYLTLGVALVVALAAAALILYRFVGLVLNAGLGGNLVTELSTPLGALVTAGAVLLYHGLQLRGDLALAAPAAGADVAPGPVVVPDAGGVGDEAPIAASVPVPADAAVATVMERRVLELIGPPGADLDAALAAARSALPSGIEIVTGDT